MIFGGNKWNLTYSAPGILAHYIICIVAQLMEGNEIPLIFRNNSTA